MVAGLVEMGRRSPGLNGEFVSDGEQLGVFHIPPMSPVCLAKGTTLHLSSALQDLQPGLVCSMSMGEGQPGDASKRSWLVGAAEILHYPSCHPLCPAA